MIYDEFIQNIINTRGQWNIPDEEYFEMHHIIPRCLGGLGDFTNNRFKRKSKHINCIWLYPKEHYMAHKLLALKYPTNFDLVQSWLFMAYGNKYKRLEIISADDYARLAELNANARAREVICIETNKRYASIKEAEAAVGFNIASSLSNYYTTANRYHWAYLDDSAKITKYANLLGTDKKTDPFLKIKKSVICIETQEVFESVVAAVNAYTDSVRACLYGRTKTACGYHWAFVNDNKAILDLSTYIGGDNLGNNHLVGPVYCVELNIKFNSIKDAVIALGVSRSSLSHVLSGTRKTAGGYHWKYIEKEIK